MAFMLTSGIMFFVKGLKFDFILSIKLPYFVTQFLIVFGPLAEWLRQSSAKASTAVRIR
jgi:hypothetical protein